MHVMVLTTEFTVSLETANTSFIVLTGLHPDARYVQFLTFSVTNVKRVLSQVMTRVSLFVFVTHLLRVKKVVKLLNCLLTTSNYVRRFFITWIPLTTGQCTGITSPTQAATTQMGNPTTEDTKTTVATSTGQGCK